MAATTTTSSSAPHLRQGRPVLRTIGRLSLVLLALILLPLGAFALWLGLRDPVTSLPRAIERPVATGATIEHRDGRRIEHIVLDAPGVGRIGLIVSLPEPEPAARLPVILVLGGLATGERNISHIERPGENAIIGYDWPIPTHLPQGWEFVSAAPDLYQRAMSVPGQIAAALHWLLVQPWADETRVSVLGFSLGALAAPAAERIAEAHGRPIGWTALAYGGSPLGDLIAANPHLKPRWIGPTLARGADLLFRPLDPASHLASLHGRFLVIAGRNDTFVPDAAARRMAELTPEPKEVVWLEGGHMGVGPNQLQLLAEIVDITTRWLVTSGATSAPQ